MQKKPKNPIKKIGKYIREVSVVVIGIAIAVSINGWISSRSERDNVDAFLQAVRLELEENLRIFYFFNQIQAFPEAKYANYLMSLNGQPANLDSLRHLLPHVIQRFDVLRATTDAFEMLKFSGYMRLIDPDLQRAIWRIYAYLNESIQVSTNFRDMRWEETRIHSGWRTVSDEELVKNPPLYDLYVHLQIHKKWKSVHSFMTEAIKMVLASL